MKVREALRLLDLRPPSRSIETRLARCHDIESLRALAARRLPRAVFDFLDGAADDEVVRRRNHDAFRRVVITPRQLSGEAEPELRTQMLGSDSSLPLAIAPCGQSHLLDPGGEPAIARAAGAAGIPYVAPAMGSATLEEIAAACSGPRWFQVYIWRDRELTAELVRRAAAAGYTALMITVDTPVSGVRTRDLVNGLTIPPKLSWRGALDAALHPGWTSRFLRAEMPRFANVTRPGESVVTTMSYVGAQFDPGAGWERVAEIASAWSGPVAVKGVLAAADARAAVDVGADAVVVSNHGGRQFGRSPATLEALPEVAAEVGGEAEVLLDSGVTRGSDVLAALALGAGGCMVGRAPLYGLAAGGEAGVVRTLELLAEDLRRSTILAGVRSIGEIDRETGELSRELNGAGR